MRDGYFLITGCGGSGTTYMASLLCSMGLEVGHEELKSHGIVSWLCAVDAERAPWGPVPCEIRRNASCILHQVRHPLKVISSAAMWANEDYLCKHMPCSIREHIVVRYAKYWYYWNRAAERNAAITFRIEALQENLEKISQLLCFNVNPDVLARMPCNLNTHRGKYVEITWEHIESIDRELCHKVQALAQKYGYSIDAPAHEDVQALKQRIATLEAEVKRLRNLV